MNTSTTRPSTSRTMRAIVQDSYGDDAEDVLRLAQIDRPEIGVDEVLLRVHAPAWTRASGVS